VDGFREADLAASNVVNVAIGADEDVTKDPGWAESRAIQTTDGQRAVTTAELEVKNVFDSRDSVFHSTDGEGQIWLGVHGAAWDGVDTVIGVECPFGGRNNGVDGDAWAIQPRCAGVGDDLLGCHAAVCANSEPINGELPISFRAEADVVDG